MPEDIDAEPGVILKRFGMLDRNGRVAASAALLFGDPEGIFDGSIVKIGRFSDDGELMREEAIDLPAIMQPDAVVNAIFERYIPGEADRYPRKAVKEAVVNAVLHKRYGCDEPVSVRITDNCIQIYNPGELPEGWIPEDLMRKHYSIRRNEKMAEVFREAGLSDSWGKGTCMICEECAENGNPPPEFTLRGNGLEVLFRANDVKRTPTALPEHQFSEFVFEEPSEAPPEAGASPGSPEHRYE